MAITYHVHPKVKYYNHVLFIHKSYLLKNKNNTTKCRGSAYLGWSVRAGVLPLVQLVPALHQLDDHGVAKVYQLEARDVCSTVHEALQVDVLKTLQGNKGTEWSWAGSMIERTKKVQVKLSTLTVDARTLALLILENFSQWRWT